ncbi:MAG: class F sortase [Dehalococcoidia bacterium]|nr:class F sortase [Dehalococcoidia bacterium]
MNLPRFSPLAALLAGAVVFVAAACGGDDKDGEAVAQTPDATATATATPSATATATPTQVPPTATPTATPFAGKVARFSMPRFGIDAPIEELGLTADNYMDTPKDTNRSVGWYHIYDRPGWDGNAIFSAHVYYHNVPAPFVNLAKSVEGDQVSVTMENGQVYTYEVISKARYHRDTIPMGEIIWPPNRPANEQWITMITCGGELDSTGQEYVSRDVVVAKRIS